MLERRRVPAISGRDEPRIALACSGLGEVRRGYERYFEELYLLTREEISIVLFKGGPRGPGIRLPRLGRKSFVSGIFGNGDSRYRLEVLSFGAAMLPSILLARCDLLHFSDYSLGALGRLPKWVFKPALLFTNGTQCTPEAYAGFDFIHLVNPMNYREAVQHGIPEDRLFMIPHGVDTDKFKPADSATEESLRRAYQIPQDDFVVVSVGYMGEGSIKRFQWVINEAASLARTPFLLLAGEQDDSTPILLEYARKKLGRGFKSLTLPLEEIPDLYALADLFVLGSLREGFGIVLIEAMASGLPVIAHKDPVIEWVVGDSGSIVNMSEKSSLANEIESYMEDLTLLRKDGWTARRRAVERFSWKLLKPQYLGMYRKCWESL